MSRRHAFIEAEKGCHPARKLCRVVRVSPSAYYRFARHDVLARMRDDAELSKRIRSIHTQKKGTYGAPRILDALRKQGIRTSQKRVARLMKSMGIAGCQPRRYKRTTVADPKTQLTDLVQRSFNSVEPNQLWASDITYVRTWEGWLYLAVVLDCHSRRIIGWSMANHMRTELVEAALRMAIAARNPKPGLIHHSDRGSQYTSDDYRALLESHKMRQSVSRPGNCWDNAVVESFFSTLKTELIYRHPWPTRRHATTAIVEYIECFYNRKRSHSTLSYQTPVAFEDNPIRTQAA
jgi:putative transposase